MTDIRVPDEPLGPASLLSRSRFEVVPMTGVEEQVALLPRGTVVTVTCSPRKGIERTLELAARVGAAGHRAVPHIAARLVRDRAHLRDVMAAVAEGGFEEIFVVGGDSTTPAGPYEGAGQLLADMAEEGSRPARVGIGAYPDGHPLIDDAALERALDRKREYATHMVTQLCFDPATVGRWLIRCRDRGIDLPVYVGIPGSLRRQKLLEISLRVGVGTSIRYVSRRGGLVARLLGRGMYNPTALAAGMAEVAGDPRARVAGFHINTFNQVDSTVRWQRQALAAWGAEGETRNHDGTAS